MFKRLSLLALAALLPVVACDEGESDSTTPASLGGAEGGKADDQTEVEETAEGACTLGEDEPREIIQFVLQDHVQFRCQGPTGFVPNSCCEAEVSSFTDASQCPLQAKWSDDTGADRRCMADDGTSEGGAFVPTACCEPLCPDDAGWREQANGLFCVDGAGQFVNSACCTLNDQAVCSAAAFDTTVSRDGERHCRNPETGRFAPSACCVDECFEVTSRDGVAPKACVDTVEDECATAEVNAAGLCIDGETGRFIKAACCELELDEPDLDLDRSDELFLCEDLNDDVIRCQTGDDAACDRQEGALDTTFDEECCELDESTGWEFCF